MSARLEMGIRIAELAEEFVAEGSDRLMGWLWSIGEEPESDQAPAPKRRARPAGHIESTLYTKFFDAP